MDDECCTFILVVSELDIEIMRTRSNITQGAIKIKRVCKRESSDCGYFQGIRKRE